jgi:PHD/YefM family antitoxin component YafN of YafNO toxin-antitoxin module
MLRTIPASEIKRRGISAVDEMLCEGAVHVIKNDRPSYVILSEEDFAELVEAQEAAYIARVKESLEDVAAGRVTRYDNVDDLIRELGFVE